jgi:hypothetical protein
MVENLEKKAVDTEKLMTQLQSTKDRKQVFQLMQQVGNELEAHLPGASDAVQHALSVMLSNSTSPKQKEEAAEIMKVVETTAEEKATTTGDFDLMKFLSGVFKPFKEFLFGREVNKDPKNLRGQRLAVRGPNNQGTYVLKFDEKGIPTATEYATGKPAPLSPEQLQGMTKTILDQVTNTKQLDGMTSQAVTTHLYDKKIDEVFSKYKINEMYPPERLAQVKAKYLKNPENLPNLVRGAQKRYATYMKPGNVARRKRESFMKRVNTPENFFFKEFGDPNTGQLNYNKMKEFLGSDLKNSISVGAPGSQGYNIAAKAYNKLRGLAFSPQRLYQDKALQLMSQSGGADTVTAWRNRVKQYGKDPQAYKKAYEDVYQQMTGQASPTAGQMDVTQRWAQYRQNRAAQKKLANQFNEAEQFVAKPAKPIPAAENPAGEVPTSTKAQTNNTPKTAPASFDYKGAEALWKKEYPDEPFDRTTFDEYYKRGDS